jgi:hypothetical protein
MKNSISKLLLTATILASPITAITSELDDIGIIGPNGEVVLYYKEGNYIIVKNCNENTILGASTAEARANCQGKSNKVPLETFKQAIRNLVSTDSLNALKPLTAEEVEAYNKDGPSTADIEKLVVELDKINAFIASYGPENANLVRKEELVKSLRSSETRISAIKKINTEIEKAIKLITDDSVLTLKKFSVDKDQFLYTVLKAFDPAQKYPCGLSGSVDERIKDCSVQETSSKGNFVLVSRSKDFKEVHKDTKSGLLWSDRLASKMTHYDAQKACKADLKEVAGVQGSWRLPSIDEYNTAESNGVSSALPNMNYWFWSSSVHQSDAKFAWVFGGDDGVVFDGFRYDDVSVRCVAP